MVIKTPSILESILESDNEQLREIEQKIDRKLKSRNTHAREISIDAGIFDGLGKHATEKLLDRYKAVGWTVNFQAQQEDNKNYVFSHGPENGLTSYVYRIEHSEYPQGWTVMQGFTEAENPKVALEDIVSAKRDRMALHQVTIHEPRLGIPMMARYLSSRAATAMKARSENAKMIDGQLYVDGELVEEPEERFEYFT